MGRLIIQHKTYICGLFAVDLESLTALFSEITKFSIILIQMSYVVDMNTRDEDNYLLQKYEMYSNELYK